MDAEWNKGLNDLELSRAVNWVPKSILACMGNVEGVG